MKLRARYHAGHLFVDRRWHGLKDCTGDRAALRGGECQEARAQVRQRRFAAAHYEGLNLLRRTESHDLLYGRTEADEPNSRCPISNLYARRCPTAPAVRANRLVIFLTGAIE